MMAWKSEELESLYESIKHKMFIGCEQEPWNGHGTVWDTIDVDDRSTEIIKILKDRKQMDVCGKDSLGLKTLTTTIAFTQKL